MMQAPSYRILLAVRGTRFVGAACQSRYSAIQFGACSSPQIGSGFRGQTLHLEWLRLDTATSWQLGQSMVTEMPQCMTPTPVIT
jgi:hypothetical protein